MIENRAASPPGPSPLPGGDAVRIRNRDIRFPATSGASSKSDRPLRKNRSRRDREHIGADKSTTDGKKFIAGQLHAKIVHSVGQDATGLGQASKLSKLLFANAAEAEPGTCLLRGRRRKAHFYERISPDVDLSVMFKAVLVKQKEMIGEILDGLSSHATRVAEELAHALKVVRYRS
ncbi:hypothetical protein THAOC_26136 [Thalassiosira oceanica]|uniref:Uncharacterized protein n=1 Tax=Thalassiosira oceanica TaxID=159749 RepID=K0RPN1_THAOC|nr:hypothetical protein THAOC_26136 [Thalassiosira oceanica]|eukprot:EJK54259.1 hypothetical protein THAOC_26136 [Thalassiosira oceanica]